MANAAWGHGFYKGLGKGRIQGAIAGAAAAFVIAGGAWTADVIKNRGKQSQVDPLADKHDHKDPTASGVTEGLDDTPN